MANNDLIFITGTTGLVGFAVLVHALKAGYRVRASVRKESQVEKLEKHESVREFVKDGKVEFVVVSDITVNGAFDGVLDGVKEVLHVASPFPRPTDDPERDIINPAINGTTSILNSALKHPTISRVVITSSGAAIVPGPAIHTGDTVNTYSPDSRVTPLPTAPWGTFAEAYRSSKVLALHAIDAFVEKQNPHFGVVNIMPGYVVGRNALATSVEDLKAGSNNAPLSVISGVKSTGARPFVVSHIDDVARVHVQALDANLLPLKSGESRNFVVAGQKDGEAFDDALAVAKERFPDAVQKGLFSEGGTVPSVHLKIDSSGTVKTFGELRTYADAVEDLVKQYIELREKGE